MFCTESTVSPITFVLVINLTYFGQNAAKICTEGNNIIPYMPKDCLFIFYSLVTSTEKGEPVESSSEHRGLTGYRGGGLQCLR